MRHGTWYMGIKDYLIFQFSSSSKFRGHFGGIDLRGSFKMGSNEGNRGVIAIWKIERSSNTFAYSFLYVILASENCFGVFFNFIYFLRTLEITWAKIMQRNCIKLLPFRKLQITSHCTPKLLTVICKSLCDRACVYLSDFIF